MLFKTWQRYFILEYLKTFFFILLLIFALYSLIDFSSKKAAFSLSLTQVLWYYLYSFSKELTVLLPFSAMLAVIKCVADMNRNRELVALLASGTSLKTLLRPFFILGVILSIFSLANQEFFYPKAMGFIHQMEALKLKAKKNKDPLIAVKSTHLNDGSTLLYTSFDPITNSLVDVVWIRGINDIYKMGSLSLSEDTPLGFEVDHFARENGTLSVLSYEKRQVFSDLPQREEILIDNLVEQQELSLTALATLASPFSLNCTSEKECGVQTSFLLRVLLPWINLMAVIGPLPMLVRYTRSQPLFLIVGLSIFSLVFVFLLLEAAAILGKRQAIPPTLALLVPFLTIFSLIKARYLALR